jgi:amidophosphoribosyltransferase
MARELGADSLFYLPLEAVARCIGMSEDRLCRACLTGDYPTPAGERLYELAVRNRDGANGTGRTYEMAPVAGTQQGRLRFEAER